jgi:general secretion pathway protein F
MPVFAYKGVNASDRKVSGVVDADTAKTARQKLRKQNIFPLEISENVERKKETGRVGKMLRMGGGVPSLELASITRQLATLVGANLPLVKSLTAIAEQTENARLQTVLTEVREAVNEGSTLADSLAKYPRIFSELYVNMIRAGEQAGALEVVFQRLADFTEKQSDLRNKVLYAMLYPAVILVMMFGVIIVMFTFVIPKITLIFQQTKQTLPPLTQAMIALSDFMRGWGGLVTIVFIVASVFGLRYYLKTPAGRERYDRNVLKIPVVGRITRNIAVSRFCKTMSTLLMSGIPIIKAMDIVEKVVGNTVLANAIAGARENITEGASIADPLRQSAVFPPFVIQMIASGEQVGELEFMLQKASETFDREVENSINGLTTLIEPIMILFLAGLVVIVILSFLMPILNLTQGIA